MNHKIVKIIEAFKHGTFQFDNHYDKGYIYAMVVNMVMVTAFSAFLKRWWHIPIFIMTLMVVEYLGRVYVWYSKR